MKSFFAGSVEAALGLAREELGGEAVLVNSRKAPPEARHLGEYEVVAAWLPTDGVPPAEAKRPPAAAAAAPAVNQERLFQELGELRRQMERMRRAVWRSGPVGHLFGPSAPAKAEALALLLETDMDPQLAREIAACVEARLAGDPLLEEDRLPAEDGDAGESGASEMRASLKAELERRFTVDASLGRPGKGPAIVALVGPPGAGKTTTLAKLAVRGGLARRRRTLMLSLDTFRIGSCEPLRTYAAVLGVALQSLATPRALEQALEESRRKELILIDTPGFGPRDMDAAEELAGMLAAHPAIDAHLVLPATMKSADLHTAVDRFELFRPGKLLFTRVDETATLGPAFSEAARTARPVSYLSTGQQVPEDLEAATRERVVELLLDRHQE